MDLTDTSELPNLELACKTHAMVVQHGAVNIRSWGWGVSGFGGRWLLTSGEISTYCAWEKMEEETVSVITVAEEL